MVDDNGAVLTVPCTMETVYGGMLYDVTKTCLYNFDPLKPHFF